MLKFLVGLVLLPTSLGALVAAARSLGGVAASAGSAWPFLIGFFGYVFLYAAVFKPTRLYVLGHELTHAAAAWLSGASVLKFFVGRKSGHVHLTQSNAFIALAPYVIPVYAAAVIAGYRVLVWAVPLGETAAVWTRGTFLLAVGASLSFHLLHTAQTLWDVHQPDLDQAGGTLFSVAVVALANGLFLILCLKCLFPRLVDAGASLRWIGAASLHFWRGFGSAAALGFRELRSRSARVESR